MSVPTSTGLDLSKNFSYFTIPAAFAVSMAPHLWAIAAVGHQRYNNANPRGFRDTISRDESIDKVQRQRILRADAASVNGFETLGFFSAAVVAANHAGIDAGTLNTMSVGYIISRIAFVLAYVFIDNRKLSYLRTLVWMAGVGMTTNLWIKTAFKMM